MLTPMLLRLIRELSTLPDRLIGPPGLDIRERVAAPVFPAASCAVTVIWFVPFTSVMLAMFQLPVPLALPVAPVPRFFQVTLATPTLSDALPLSETVELVVVKLLKEVGEVIETVGTVVSAGVDPPEPPPAGPDTPPQPETARASTEASSKVFMCGMGNLTNASGGR